MRTTALAATLAFLAGCTLGEPERPDVPVPTDGANQVVIKVPGMTCEECPKRVSEALAGVAWIDAQSIKADRKTRQVVFTVKDRAQFDFEALKEKVRKAGYTGSKLLTPPTEK